MTMIFTKQINSLHELDIKYKPYKPSIKGNYDACVAFYKTFIAPFQQDEDGEIYKKLTESWHQIIDMYNSPERTYHNLHHLSELFFLINELSNLLPENPDPADVQLLDDLGIVAVFHDAVYDVRKGNNEELSTELFKVFVDNFVKLPIEDTELRTRLINIADAIMETKTHIATTVISSMFCAIDMYVITHYPFSELMKYEHRVFKEYQMFDYSKYLPARINLLCELNERYNNPDIEKLIDYVSTRKIRIGVYAGSFNPFHIGHLNIFHQAQSMFDKVIIARGVNPEKDNIKELKTNFSIVLPFVQYEEFTGYIYEYVHSKNSDNIEVTLVKGLRNADDFKEELKQHRYNRFLQKSAKHKKQLNAVYLFSDAEFEHISSRDIRMMEKIKEGSALDLMVIRK